MNASEKRDGFKPVPPVSSPVSTEDAVDMLHFGCMSETDAKSRLESLREYFIAPAYMIDGNSLAALLPGTHYMDEPDGGPVTILEQLQRMAADAARYRMIRQQHEIDDDLATDMNYGKSYPPRTLVVFGPGSCDMIEPVSCVPGTLDAVVDRLIARGGK